MKIVSKKSVLAGHITVPGSKSHTIRALILAGMANGTSHIYNPLESNDCLSTVEALKEIGAEVSFDGDNTTSNSDFSSSTVWTVKGKGSSLSIPNKEINVGNSGSLMYFLSPVLSTLDGECTFTGDESICKRPVDHLVDAFKQLDVDAAYLEESSFPPFSFKGPININKTLKTDGALSQYISGFMMAATRMNGTLNIELENPKETPYITMTENWLKDLGCDVSVSKDYKKISVTGPTSISPFDKTIPSDWEGVAFPLIGCLISGSNSEIVIDNIDLSGSQGDAKIVELLQSVGANIVVDKNNKALRVCGNKRLSTKGLSKKTLKVNISEYPDAICALAVIACYIEGKTIITDIDICRKKETDRVAAMTEILSELGAEIKDEGDKLVIIGHNPFNEDGTLNTKCRLHGGKVDSYKDHRIAMSLACFGLGLKNNESIEIKDSECASVSFPHFFEEMNKIGAGFAISE